jgi:hypothetical protein
VVVGIIHRQLHETAIEAYLSFLFRYSFVLSFVIAYEVGDLLKPTPFDCYDPIEPAAS